MKKLILLILIVALSGCASLHVNRENNGDCDVTYSSLFKDFKNISGNICGGEVKVEESTSKLDAKTALEILDAIK